MGHLPLLLAAAVAAARLPDGPPPAAPAALPAVKPSPVESLKKLAHLPHGELSLWAEIRGNEYRLSVVSDLKRRALARLEHELEAHPDDPDRLGRAAALAWATWDEAAEVRYCDRLVAVRRRAVDARPADLAVRLALAEALIQAGRWHEATAAARVATRLAPGSADAWRVRGRAISGCDGPPDQADAAFREAWRLAPADWKVPLTAAEAACDRAWRIAGRHAGPPEKFQTTFTDRLRMVRSTPADQLWTRALLAAADVGQQTAARLEGKDPECLRRCTALGIGILTTRYLFESERVSVPALSRSVGVPLTRLADAEPVDAWAVLLAVGYDIGVDFLGRGLFSADRPVDLDYSTLIAKLPAEVRDRHTRWFARLRERGRRDDEPGAAETALVAGYLFMVLDRHGDLMSFSRRAVELAPDDPNAQMLFIASRLKGTDAEIREAVEQAKKWVSRADTPLSRFALLRCYETAGDDSAVRAETARAVAAHPDDPRLVLCAAAVALGGWTGEMRKEAGERLDAAQRMLDLRPDDKQLRRELTRLLIIHHALAGNYSSGLAALQEWADAGQAIDDDEDLRAAIRALVPPQPAVPALPTIPVIPVSAEVKPAARSSGGR